MAMLILRKHDLDRRDFLCFSFNFSCQTTCPLWHRACRGSSLHPDGWCWQSHLWLWEMAGRYCGAWGWPVRLDQQSPVAMGWCGQPVTALFLEGCDRYMVFQGRETSGSSFGKVAASRATPFVWWWRGLVSDRQTFTTSPCQSSWPNHRGCWF